ncbi:heat-inducible transcriptional repressor HrcA [Parvularcula sp. ZS-1/3]|uniref:Heat-inducible transcription repressor HrcA n=1 Tax=Parvularcula mediterranea TaxID=2732508 RepID=A0A7Y3RLM8_9PROT|nr:heat-inducible transcriptional repressor HrcA [Parvularcula mediterranea]
MAKLTDIDVRSRQIFKELVETYLETGEPVGSRTLSRRDGVDVSPATIRNVMADLSELGLLDAPHTSAGRMPTERGLRLFVDGMLEVGQPTPEERAVLDQRAGAGDAEAMLDSAAGMLSGLTRMASVVMASKSERPIKHLEFVRLDDRRALAVIVDEGGDVENRLLDLPPGLPATSLIEAANYLNAQLTGRTLREAQRLVNADIEARKTALDDLTTELVKRGIAEFSQAGGRQLIVRGQSNLLAGAQDDLARVQQLFDELERKEGLLDLLEAARDGEGVRIFIGAENRLFSLSGSSVVAAPYRDRDRNIVGVLGVVGPTRLNYGRVIPLVDYTAELVTRMMR